MSVAPVPEPGPFCSVEDAIEEIRRGRMVVVVDAADRENEGDLTIAGQFATPEAIAFMAKEGRGPSSRRPSSPRRRRRRG